jgi:lipopolysaccharide/colanic/teichoic acid biosynthesis glycosyltransferase
MHILLIHQVFVSSEEAGGTRHYELGQRLVRRGHRVTVVASTVSYLTGRVLRLACGRLFVHEQLNGVDVFRSWAYPALHRSFFSRVLSFVSFMVSSLIAALRVEHVDIVWGTSPPIFQGLTAWLVARMRRIPFVFEVRDLWPDFAVEMGILRNPLLVWLSRKLEHFLYRHSARVVVNSPGFIPHLRRCGVACGKIELVPNGVQVDMYNPDDRGAVVRNELGLDGRFIALYAGAHGPANDLGTMLLAAKSLEKHANIVFVLVGDGKDRSNLIHRAEQLHLPSVCFVPARPKAQMPAFLAAADVCVAILKPIPMFTTTYPNKVFDYMAAGRPTVLAIDGVIRHVIESARGGVFVRPGSPDALAEAVLQYYKSPELRRQHGLNARSYVVGHFDRTEQAEKLRSIFESVIAGSQLHQKHPAFKRVFDILFSAIALVLLCPVLAAITLAIFMTMGRPVLYVSQRPGVGGRIFRLYKFRTMTEERRADGKPLPDSKRLTALGRFLRRLSLDEIPQLWNVLKGDMSLVGPRPLLVEYLDRYTPAQARRHEVRPGITGWAQVNGRNALTWEQKFDMDVWYVEHQSFWSDMKIILLTLLKVVRREGISQPGHETMEEFLGSVPERTCASALHQCASSG